MALHAIHRISVSLLASLFVFLVLFSCIVGANTIIVENMSGSVTPEDLVYLLLGENSTVTVSNISVTGSDLAIGSFTSGGSLGFDTGVVMSSGVVSDVPNDMDFGASTDNVQPGDPDLNTLVSADTFDAIVLEFDFIPEKSSLAFNYRFGSEESFLDNYDDAFGLFVNGENVALLPDGNPVSIFNIREGTYYQAGPLNNCFNGFSIVLTANAEVDPGVLNHMKFALADMGDAIVDAVVFIEGDSFVSTTSPNAPTDLLCEGETNATDITDMTPEFSWTFSDSDSDDIQGAYQIQVGTNEGGSDMWDSGQVTSSSSINISYAGSDLDYSTTYYWRVRTWDNNNAAGPYCDDQTFATAEEILPPVANFTANVTTGRAPLTVNFTDLSTNTPTSWLWDFGDGSTSHDQNPTYTYTRGGNYTVILNATNIAGTNTSTQVDCINVVVATTVNASYTSVTYNENDDMTIDAGMNVTGSSTFTSARVYIGDGYIAGEDILRFTNTSSINGSFNPLTGILSLSGSGSAADYQEAFRNVRYENINDNPNTSDRNITFVMGDNAVYLESTGHYYESIHSESAISWTDARAAAEARSLSGMQGYLATILTEDESVFLGSKAPDNAWIGANDAAEEREWRWVTGPENLTGEGTLFYYQDNSTTLPGFYTNWNSGEPNDWDGVEDYGQILGAGNKKWNDLPNVADVYYYLVEYGGMPDEPTPQLTATITVNVNSVNDAPTTPGNFISPTNGQIKQGGQLMTASWGVSTDPEDDAVMYDLWFFNGSWTKIGDLLNTNSQTFTLPTDNINTAMLRVYANDTQDNSSARDVTFTIDSLGPVISYGTNGNNTYSKNHSTTATGTDNVAGLAQISYAWTNDPDVGSVSSWTDFINGATLTQDIVSGDWYLHINATDNVSNSNYSVSDIFKLDNILPLIHFGTDGNATYAQSHSTNVTVVDPLSGVQALAYSWTNDPNVSSVSQWTVFNDGATLTRDSVDGDWYLYIRATDNASNINYSVSNAFSMDNSLPVIHFSIDGNATYAQSHSTNVTVVDPLSGIGALAYSWTSDPNVSSVSHWTAFNNGATLTKDSVEGDWYLHIRATDNASNTNYSVSNAFALDNTLPVVSISGNPASWQNTSAVLNISIADMSDVSQVKWDTGILNTTYFGSSGTTLSSPFSFEISENGNYTVYVMDEAGNENVTVFTVSYIDTALPSIALAPNGNNTYSQSHSSTITSLDSLSGVQSLTYSWSQNSNVGSVSSWTVCDIGDTVTKAYANGNWYLHVRSTDNAGNVNYSVSNVFKLDNGLPVIHIENNGNDTYSRSHGTGVAVSDALSGIHQLAYAWTQYSNVSSVSQWTAFINGATLTKNSGDGDWHLHIRAIDNAGNANYSVSSSFRLDNTAPAYTWIWKPLNADTGDTVVIELNATDVSSVSECSITVNGEEHQMNTSSGVYSWTLDIPASDSGILVSQVIYSCTLSDLLGNMVSTGNVRMNVSILPIADFTVNTTRGTAPLTVGFVDGSYGRVQQWYWNFRDGSTSSEQNPVHTFGSGDFTVNLTVTNSNGTSSQQLNIRAVEPLRCTTFPDDQDTISIYGEEMTFSVTANILSSFSWYLDGEQISGNGITMSSNDDSPSSVSFCTIDTSEYIDQDDFFLGDYNVSVVVSNETTGMSDTFSWDWTVTNSSAVEDSEDISFVISRIADITSAGNMSYVGFNTTDERTDNSNLAGSITFVSFNTPGNASDLRIKVEVLDKSSLNESEAGFSQGSVYQYFDISFNNQTLVDNTGLNRSIKFRVLNELDEENLVITSVMLKHWGDPAWEVYVPELLSNDGTYSYFIVRNISGFSPFAITANYEHSSGSGSGSGTGRAIASPWPSQEDTGKAGGAISYGLAGSEVSSSTGSSTGAKAVAGDNVQTNDGIEIVGEEKVSNGGGSNLLITGFVMLVAGSFIFVVYRKKKEEDQ
ncbi:MAG: choice-of-anchor L domain-containing protein [Methanomethylovorans sp.]|nr:choice-of-anchor L domain-containing protein [Methanomethylovorans sp.]